MILTKSLPLLILFFACTYGQECLNGINVDNTCYCSCGYEGETCNECAEDYFTNKCISCTNCNHGTCSNGSCNCLPGWEGVFCDNSKPIPCDPPCQNGGVCSDDGVCLCHPNFNQLACQECAPNHFGPNCTECPPCQNGICAETITGNGTCICEPRFEGDLCDLCIPFHYGVNCTACPDCGDHGECRYFYFFDNFDCICARYYTGVLCDECEPDRYGPNCDECPNCNHGICSDTITGDGTCQ